MLFSRNTWVDHKKFKLALYVHDMKLEIGHSNSLIELVKHLPNEYINRFSAIEVVSYTSAPLKELFPEFRGDLNWIRVPFANIRPVIFKSLFYQIWAFCYNILLQKGSPLRIGIGISSLHVDAVSIQFIHHQWTEKGLELESTHFIRRLYKKLLFWYFEMCEKFLFSQKNLKLFSPARFLTEYLSRNFTGSNVATIYSGVNLKRFELIERTKESILEELQENYPVLNGLNIDEPIYLFVGAYERKGLQEALNILRGQLNAQFIVIGSPSLGKSSEWPSNLRIFPITFTKEISKFYSLSDVFLFPTIYEPFGLVLFEAMAMGLMIITRLDGVGASELLLDLPEVYFSDDKNFILPEVDVKSIEDKKRLRDSRLGKIGDVSWKKAGSELAQFLEGPLN